MPKRRRTHKRTSSRLVRLSLLRLRYATRYTGVDAICRQCIGYTRVASNFYHDLIDRLSTSGALLFAFFLDSGTVVTETRGREQGGEFSLPFPPPSAGIYTFMLICS